MGQYGRQRIVESLLTFLSFYYSNNTLDLGRRPKVGLHQSLKSQRPHIAVSARISLNA